MDLGGITGSWDYSTLPANVRVGEGCYLEDRKSFERFGSQRDPGLVLGRGVRVYTWTRFTTEPGGVIRVGDGSTLVGAAFWCAGSITIGEGVVVSYNVTIADSDFHPKDPDLRCKDTVALAPEGDGARPPVTSAPVVIGDGARIGIGAIILKGVRIGAGAEIGAGAVVASDVPPGTRVFGNPARVIQD